ncbi:hypothetical protein ACFYNZ_34735 [Streptomyces kebangsaanensis]|uniref:DUF2231 domain-containing protein n=1 Tax=Streptomyces kebangsaanensis TaxID=864058 RepID=A0ABW6L353_9ACTN
MGRFLAGRDMDGIERTDGTFFRRGTRVPPRADGTVHRASYRPGRQRLVVRLTVLGTAVGGCAYWQEPEATLTALEYVGAGTAAATAAAGIAYGILGRERRERRELMREWVVPLHLALAGGCGVHASVSWIADAEPGADRVPFGVVVIVLCVVVTGQGAVMLRYGPVLFRGRPRRMEWLESQSVAVMVCSGVGAFALVCDGLAGSGLSLGAS